ncbi:MAG TPA: hypothetical protein VKA95_06410 [Nitrososphaeraceae archaeon]|nr:hypothetical protein [Nitrososphaeraceae archaeon]
MSTILTEKDGTLTSQTSASSQQKPTCRRSTSMFIDRMLWLRVRKAALDSGTTATEFVESALNEKLAKVEGQGKGVQQ